MLLAHAIGLDSPLRKVKVLGESIASSEFALIDELFAAFAASVIYSGTSHIKHVIMDKSPENETLSPFAYTSWDALRLDCLNKQAGMMDAATFKSELVNRSHYFGNVFNFSRVS